jgi:hypothetical protein
VSRCSECSHVVRPVVAVDVDGCISEYHNSLRDHCVRYWNLSPHPCEFGSWNGIGNFEDWIGITNAQYREAKLAYRQGGYKRWSPVYEGLDSLVSMISHLKEQFLLEVWVTTQRPWLRLDNVDPDTRFWLDKHFPDYDHLLYHDQKYTELAGRVEADRVVAVVDDLPEMVAQAAGAFGSKVPLMIHRPHNSLAHPSVPRVENLEAFAERLHERTTKWWERNK